MKNEGFYSMESSVNTSSAFNKGFVSRAKYCEGSSIYEVHKNWPIFWPPYPHHPQKWTEDLLFKDNRIRKHVTNFKTPPGPFCVDVINVWSLHIIESRKCFLYIVS